MKYLFNILFLLFNANCFCQVWTNNGVAINIVSGTFVNVDSLRNVTGTITNSGTITLRYNYNNQATVNGSGDYNIGGNWANSGTFTAGSGVVMFNGASAQDISFADAFNNITINKTAGSAILSSDITVNGTLHFISGKIQTGVNNLVIPSAANITGSGQGTGWVYGNLQKYILAGATSQTYEVGDNTHYSPVTLALSGVTSGGNLTTDVTATDHPNINTSLLNPNKSVNRYFTFINNGVVFTDAAIMLNWVAPDVDPGASTANFKVGKYNGSSWSYPTIASPNPTSIQVTGITSFGSFAIGESLNALPVTLTTVRAYTKNTGVQVEWVTQLEINMDMYEVERSANGQQFTKTGTVLAKGNSNAILNYSWFDANPFSGISYYRIKSIEKSGNASYSQIVKVNRTTGGEGIIFYPNPVVGNTIQLQLNNIPQGDYIISITNNLGQQVFKKLILHNGGSAIQTIDVHNLVKGIYQLSITGGEINFTKKVLKN